MSRKAAFVEETEFIMHTGWPSVQGEVKTIIEVETDVGDYSPAEFAAEEQYLKNSGNRYWILTWGRNETSYKAVEESTGRIRYFSYREI